MDDRRKYPRFKLGVEVHWKRITTKERTAQHISHTKDLSTGGVCMVLHEGVKPGDTLQLDIQIPGKEPLVLTGKVAWVNAQSTVQGRKDAVCEGGVEFHALSDADLVELNHLITHSLKNTSRK